MSIEDERELDEIAERFIALLAAEINEGRHEYSYIAVGGEPGHVVLDGGFDPATLYKLLREVMEP